MGRTISQILNEYGGFDKAFWSTYSVDFSTLDFLLKRDFKQIMAPYYFHLICDGDKLDETIAAIYNDRSDMSKLSKLQEYCTISPQFTDGAFHPKILLFASEKSMLVIVSSANATPSGILSNQDLIGLFYYDDNQTENKNEVCSLFQYLRNFSGWGIEAIEDFKILEERFNFLKQDTQTDHVLTIPHNNNLLSQIKESLPEVDQIKAINIFSPFFDDNYKAIFDIENYFKKPVNIFSPQKEFKTARTDNLPDNIRFFNSDNLKRRSFHAKFYEFNYGEESIVYWGSANCSYSGLLNNNRNYEILLRCQIKKDEVYDLWGELEGNKESNVEYGIKIEDDNVKPYKKEICIEGVSIDEGCLIITVDKPINTASLKGVTYNGSIVDLIIKSVEGNRVDAIGEEKGLVIIYLEKKGERISNLIYINNPNAIKERILGQDATPEFNPKKINNQNSINIAFGFFNIETPFQKGTSPKSPLSSKGFWRLPHYRSRSSLSGIINLDTFIKTRVVKFKEKTDEDNFDQSKINKKKNQKFNPQTIVQKISKETEKLLKNINTIEKEKRQDQIKADRWLKGLDILNYFILDYLDENDELLEIDKLNILLLNASRVSSWIALNLIGLDENYHERLELIRSVQYLFLTLSIYEKLSYEQFLTPYRKTKERNKNLHMIKRALYLRYVVNAKFPRFRTPYSSQTEDAVVL